MRNNLENEIREALERYYKAAISENIKRGIVARKHVDKSKVLNQSKKLDDELVYR